jgi:hypothetical protein
MNAMLGSLDAETSEAFAECARREWRTPRPLILTVVRHAMG